MDPVVRILILVRGVPGSGKSTYAKSLGVEAHYEADMWFDANGGYDPTKIAIAHDWCQRKAVEAMESGKVCVVSNTFTRLWEMEFYRSAARRLGYEVREVVMTGNWPNVHGVPEDKVRQMRDRFEYANPAVRGSESSSVPCTGVVGGTNYQKEKDNGKG